MKLLLSFGLIVSFLFISCAEEFYLVRVKSEYETRLIFELVNVGKVELENGDIHLWEEVEGNKNYTLTVSEVITPDHIFAATEFYLDKDRTFTIIVDGSWKR